MASFCRAACPSVTPASVEHRGDKAPKNDATQLPKLLGWKKARPQISWHFALGQTTTHQVKTQVWFLNGSNFIQNCVHACHLDQPVDRSYSSRDPKPSITPQASDLSGKSWDVEAQE